ncbi:hypothetical protein ACFL1B_03120 [Nanoarchaeota archaeon]
MRAIINMILVLMIVLPVNAYVLTMNEDEYGENQVRIKREAEALWVRDNFYIFYDFESKKNHYMSKLNDRDIIYMMRNYWNRERTGVDDADLTVYYQKVRDRDAEKETKQDIVKQQAELSLIKRELPEKAEPVLEQPKKILIARAECARSTALTIYDPWFRVNRWMNMLSDENLEKVMVKTGSFRRCIS